jgi:hypothetical protein
MRASSCRPQEAEALLKIAEVAYIARDLEYAAVCAEGSVALYEKIHEDLIPFHHSDPKGSQTTIPGVDLSLDKIRRERFKNYEFAYELLQLCLIKRGQPKEALVVAEKSKAKALTQLLRAKGYAKTIKEWSCIQDIAFSCCSTLLVYSVLRIPGHQLSHSLVIWVVSCSGELLACIETNLEQDLAEFGGDIRSLLEMTKEKLGARGCFQHRTASDLTAEPVLKPKFRFADDASEIIVSDKFLLSKLHKCFVYPVNHVLRGCEYLVIVAHKELFIIPWAATI